MEDQRRDIVKGIWFLALMFSSLIFSARCQSDPSMTLEVSPNLTVQQAGTTVSLLCHVDGFDASTHFLSWIKEGPGIFGVTSKDVSVYRNERYLVSFTEDVISTFNLTFSEVETTDTGTYECNLIRQIDETYARGELKKGFVLSVYPIDAFPSCSPNGLETLTVGSPMSCSTSGNATPSIDAENGEWALYSFQSGGKALLLKNVTTSDNSQTYICVANLPASDMNLSCTIGPLTVVDIESTTQTTTTTTRPTGITVVKSGLSVGQIAGIIIGLVVFNMLVAIHVLCFRFDPRRWRLAKDFLIGCCNSRETSKAREDASRSPPDVSMSREGDDVSHVYCSTLTENPQPGLPSIQPVEQEKDASTSEADPYMELDIAYEKPSQYAELKL